MVGEVVTSGPIYKGHGGIRPLEKLWRSRDPRAEKPINRWADVRIRNPKILTSSGK
ncbi:uncharacterized protein RCO7_07607 [Rhynchosporium graminicola]|uniref:Uncharacterized protein n=1 Tax=Rhynchosporium graminicola TaxID=2792576 RepID=A0A1E1KZN8_9HELO|nr:uncharacterized protein RCO7_07607 [Rhynchosporium commune]